MKLVIDGNESGIEYDDSLTLEQALMDLNARLLTDEKRVILEIKLDETVPGLDMELMPDQVTCDKIIGISVQTRMLKDSVADCLDEAEIKFSETPKAIAAIIDDIMADKIETAMNSMKDELDLMIWFFSVLQQANIGGLLDFTSLSVGDGSLLDFIGKFNSTLGELVTAMKNNDMTLINDYLEYEYEPSVAKILAALPSIKAAVKGNPEQ